MDAAQLLAETNWVRALARRLVADESEADDLVQEAWLAALRARERVDDPKAWLGAVLRNRARMRWRGEGRRAEHEGAAVRSEHVPSTAELAEREELRALLVRLVDRLPEAYRSVVLLRYYEGRPPREIARRLDVPVATVRTRLARALDRLRGGLDEERGGRRSWALALVPLARGGDTMPAATGALGVAFARLLAALELRAVRAALLVTALSIAGWMALALRPGPSAGERIAAAPAGTSDPVAEGAPVASLPGSRETADRRAVEAAARAPAPAPIERSTGTVTGRFRDVAGRALPGVELWRIHRQHPESSERLGRGEDDGSFSIAVPAGERSDEVFLQARRAGIGRRNLSIALRRGDVVDLGDQVLPPACTLRGRVVDLAGGPVAGARVLCSQVGEYLNPERRYGPSLALVGAVTEGDGAFELADAPRGEVLVWAKHEGTLWTTSEPVALPRGADLPPIELRLEPIPDELRIDLGVRDARGEGVQEAWILARGQAQEGWSGYVYRTDARGRCVLHLLASAPQELTVFDESGRFRPLTVGPVEPGTRDLVVSLEDPRTVPLSVRDEAGGTIRDYAVRVHGPGEPRRTLARWGLGPDEEGRAEIDVPNVVFQIEVEAAGHRVGSLGPLDPDDLPAELSIVLDPIAAVRGRVVARGRPVGGALVGLHEAREGDLVNDFPTRSARHATWSTRTDQDGQYELGVRAEGTYYLRVTAAGFASSEIGPLVLDPARDAGAHEVELGPGGVLEGRVLVGPGEDPGGVIVGVSRGDGCGFTQGADPDGRFRFERLTPGRWQVERRDQHISADTVTRTGSWSGPLPWSCEVLEGRTTHFDLDLRVAYAAELFGSFLLGSQAVPGLLARLAPADGPEEHAVEAPLDDLGMFRLHPREPGAHRLWLRGPLGEEASIDLWESLVLLPGANLWELDLPVASLTIELGARPPAQGITLVVGYPLQGSRSIQVEIDEPSEGPLRLSRVPAGRAMVLLGTKEGPPDYREIDLQEGGAYDVRFP